MRKLLPIGLTVMLLLAACGGNDPSVSGSQGSGGGVHGMDVEDEGFAFGEPGDQSEADRTIEISALDPLAFDPDSVEIESGETVTFVVSNDGENSHEFVLGDNSYQEDHAAEMSGGEDMGMGPNQIGIQPGEAKSLTWTFTEVGEVLYGCHEPGHYEGGMVGTAEVGT